MARGAIQLPLAPRLVAWYVLLMALGYLALMPTLVVLPKAETAGSVISLLGPLAFIAWTVWKSFSPLYEAATKRILPSTWWCLLGGWACGTMTGYWSGDVRRCISRGCCWRRGTQPNPLGAGA